MKNRISKTVYWLDRHDKIIRVCDFWDQFALENDGDNVISSRVVGKHVLDFVHGDTTRMWIETLLQLSRLRGAYLERPYRCDSPDMRRYMKLGIFPESSGILRLEHTLVSTEEKKFKVQIRVAPDETVSDIRQRCSICGRIHSDRQWIEPEQDTHVCQGNQPVGLDVVYVVCDDCQLPR